MAWNSTNNDLPLKSLLNNALQAANISQWPTAYFYYMEYLDRVEDMNNISLTTQMHFCKVIKEMASSLDDIDDEEIVASFLSVLNLFPENAIIWNAMAVYMFKRGEFELARIYFDKALSTPLPFLQAEKNALHLTWHQVPRWHFRMLNDTSRNNLYRQAIHGAIRQNYKKIFDIGAGCGLLSLIAANSNEKDVEIQAFEESQTLATIAIDTIKDNQYEKKIEIHKIHSNQYPCRRLGNLIVAEIFDVALFGEHALNSLLHAVENFVENDFKIIPASAQMYVTGIQSEKLTNKIRYKNQLPINLCLDNVCIKAMDIETYDAETLTMDNCKFVTKTVMFHHVDFRDTKQLREMLSGNKVMPDCQLECLEDASIDALAVWFDLNLDNDIILSTNPLQTDIKCWEQAIFYLKHPIQTIKKNILIVQPTLKDNELIFDIKNQLSSECNNCFSVSREIITFLNDKKLIDAIINAASSLTVNKNYANSIIVDYHCFPLFGLIMYINGANIIHYVRDPQDLKLINYILNGLNLDVARFKCCDETNLMAHLTGQTRIDLIFNDCVNVDGSWFRQGMSEEMIEKFGPRILPEKITLKVQLINSQYIDFCNKVDDKRCFNFGIAKHINKFTGTEHPNLEEFSYQKLSTIAEFDLSDFSIDRITTMLYGNDCGIANAILFWFEFNIINENSGGTLFSTLNSTHYCRACVILSTPIQMNLEDRVQVHIERDETYLKIYCD